MNSRKYSRVGTTVVFTGASDEQVAWGGNDDPRPLLTVGEKYVIESVDVHSWHTKVTLVGIKGRFNDVSFKYCGEPYISSNTDTYPDYYGKTRDTKAPGK